MYVVYRWVERAVNSGPKLLKKIAGNKSVHSLSPVRTLLFVKGIDISSTSVMDTSNCDCFSVFLLTLSSVFKLLLSFKIF